MGPRSSGRLSEHIHSMWVPLHAKATDGMLQQIYDRLLQKPTELLPAPLDPVAAGATCLQLMALPEDDEDDGGDDGEMEAAADNNPEPLVLPSVVGFRRAGVRPRLGVDLGGVLLPKFDGRDLRGLSIEDLRRTGFTSGAREWLRECMRALNPENVFIVSFVGSLRMRQMLISFLDASNIFDEEQSGLEHGLPLNNLIWTDLRRGKTHGKAAVFLSERLTHFIDDQIDVLMDIREACHKDANYDVVPSLYLVPTVWAARATSEGSLRRCLNDIKMANGGWEPEWRIQLADSVTAVHPSPPDV